MYVGGDGATTVVAGSLNVINEATMTHSARARGDRLRRDDKGLRKSSPSPSPTFHQRALR